MIHPDTEVRFISLEKGRGLFASKAIPAGTIVWCRDPLDREISPLEMDNYTPVFREILLTYSFRNNKGNYIFCWDNGRYINHSFASNCCSTPYEIEIAIRNIEKGEELTDDYGFLNIIEPFEALPEGTERSVVYPDDLLRYSDLWDVALQNTFPKIKTVPQPLQNFMSLETWQKINNISAGKEPLASIRSCYFSSSSKGSS
ncbi:SET domain-containing protein [Desulfopila sp. IMCC35008]|uniref:SET domain-containing protein n=1 Tax=Desulfopila sp. IMCC35008 TaxID=2653858 RepID=UPI0013D47EBB|nr:SET domain-containing protein [Desulfopila sp. IMCC35008]